MTARGYPTSLNLALPPPFGFVPGKFSADEIPLRITARRLFLNEGFLGTAAPRYADVVLLLEVGMGLGLLAGALLARMRRFRAHAFCQAAIVLLNAAVIVLVMVPSFRTKVSPKIPLNLGKGYYAVATAHAALGSIVESGGLYILLAAGTKLLPQKLRITNYKLWMRAVLAGWWVVLSLGMATYARWYIPHLFRW